MTGQERRLGLVLGRLGERQRRVRVAVLHERPGSVGHADRLLRPERRPGVSHWPECPDNLFQYHHQPFNYYAAFSTQTAAGLANRAAHLKDEQEFLQVAQQLDEPAAT